MRELCLHACDSLPSADGNVRAVTLRSIDGVGVIVWIGALRPESVAKLANRITPDDYAFIDTLTFRTVPDAWTYGSWREYSVLIEDVRFQADTDTTIAELDRSTTTWVRKLVASAVVIRDSVWHSRSRRA